jgi:NitT/TauT family transport system substrate-binding protein
MASDLGRLRSRAKEERGVKTHICTQAHRSVGLRRVVLVSLLVVVASTAASCGGSSKETKAGATGSAPRPTITVAARDWIGDSPYVIAHEKGLDKKNGINLNFKLVEELKDITSSLGAHRIQAGYAVGPGQALTLVQAKIPVKFVMLGDLSIGGDQILSRSDIRSVKQLKGKSVGVETASTGYPMLVYALQQNGLGLNDIHQVELTGSQAAVALNTGRVDAAYTWQPYISIALGKGFRTLFQAGNKRGIISDFLVVTDRFAKKEDQVVKLLKTWQAGVEYFRAHPEESYKLVANGMKLPLKDVKLGLDPTQLQLTDLEQSAAFFRKDWPTLAPIFTDIVNGAANAPRKVEASEALDAVDNSYAQKALGQ